MWPGSRPATGWMPNRTLTPLLAQVPGQLGDRVLGLRDGHAVAGGDDHRRRRLGEQLGDLLGGGLAVLAVVRDVVPTAPRCRSRRRSRR